MSAVGDFKSEYFMEEFEKTLRDSDAVRRNICERVALLIDKLDTNEKMIGALREKLRMES
jgi:hypothetical protein